MKKHIVVIEEVTHQVVCLEADNARDLLNWNDLDSFRRLPMDTLDKLKRIDRETEGFWRFAQIHTEDDVIKSSQKTPELPKFTILSVPSNLEIEY